MQSNTHTHLIMNKQENKEIAMCNFIKNKADEIGDYMERNKIENALVIAALTWLIAYIIEPPKGTNRLFAETFGRELYSMLNKMYKE